MLTPNGERLLKEYAEKEFPKQMLKVSDSVYHVLGYGHSSSIVIIADESVILVDATNSRGTGLELKNTIKSLTDKPVRTIIFTHGHPDHRGGAGAFRDTVEEVIAFTPAVAPLALSGTISTGLNARSTKQFGYNLSDDELITQGLGPREDVSGYDFIPPTTIYDEEEVELEVDGRRLLLVRAQGETDDQLFVWLEDEKALCCGDNYYACWPNLYAVRGSSYRDVAAWVDSLGKMIEFNAEYLLPGHTRPIVGAENVRTTLTNYRAAIDSILRQTLSCIESGKNLDETVGAVKLPKDLAELPYLREHYGSIDWSVRSIYQGYVGWFDGMAMNLHPLSLKERAGELIPALGGVEKVTEMIGAAQTNGKWQWALELCELALCMGPNSKISKMKVDTLLELAKLETSSNGRHYYQATAHEEETMLQRELGLPATARGRSQHERRPSAQD